MWRFVQLSDTHLGSSVDGQWNNGFLCSMMPDVIACLRRDLAKLKPDFLLVTGDISSHQTRDAVYAARDLVDSLGVPYYPMGGNHDFAFNETRSYFAEAFQSHLPGGDTVYSFSHKNLRFCVLDPWWKWKDGTLCPVSESSLPGSTDSFTHGAQWAIPPHQFAWLEEELEAHSQTPTILAFHYPAISIPNRLRRPGLKDAGHLSNGGMLMELLAHHPQVKAVMSGHLHMHIIERTGGVVHVVTGSMPEYPCEYRDVRVYPDRLEIATCELSDTSFAARSLLPGRDFTAGHPEDREAVIPFG